MASLSHDNTGYIRIYYVDEERPTVAHNPNSYTFWEIKDGCLFVGLTTGNSRWTKVYPLDGARMVEITSNAPT